MIAEGLKGNCSVTEVSLVSGGLLLVRLLLLTCVEQDYNIEMSDAVERMRQIGAVTQRIQDGNKGMSDAVKREITQGLQEGHGADKGVAIYVTASSFCRFFDFETCEGIDLNRSKVRLLSLHDAA
jgi:hypothetical protein